MGNDVEMTWSHPSCARIYDWKDCGDLLFSRTDAARVNNLPNIVKDGGDLYGRTEAALGARTSFRVPHRRIAEGR